MHAILAVLVGIAALAASAFFVAPASAPAEPIVVPIAGADEAPAADEPAAPATEVAADLSPAAPQPATVGADDAPAAPALDINAAARGSLVNIFCITKTGGEDKPASGSGIIIDARGVVLTNAHVAQYLLLRDYPRRGNIDCRVRAGSPAREIGRAMILYVPPAWVAQNASLINDEEPRSTGENDFALLYLVDGGGAPLSLSATLAALKPDTTPPATNERMLLAAYPAGFLSGQTISQNLYPGTAYADVVQRYTFADKRNVDLVAFGGSIVSQAGSSGGAAVRQDGTLAGLIVTASLDGDTSERRIRALTLAHIERVLDAAGYGSLDAFLTGNLQSKALDFEQNIAPGLIDQLQDALGN